MRARFILYITLITIYSCQRDYNQFKSATRLLPKTSEVVIRISEPQNLESLDSETYIADTLNKGINTNIKNLVGFINPLSEVYLAIENRDAKKTITIITEYHDELIPKDSLQSLATKEAFNDKIDKLVSNEDTLYYKIFGKFFFGSTNPTVIDNISVEQNNFQKLFSTSSNSETATILYTSDTITGAFLLNTKLKQDFTQTSIIDVATQNNNFRYNGITTSKDSLDIINSFKNTTPKELKVSKIIPNTIKGFERIGFDSFDSLAANLSVINNKEQDSLNNLLGYTNEIALAKTNDSEFLVVSALDINLLQSNLVSIAPEATFRDFNIYSFKNTHFFEKILLPFFSFSTANYFVIVENFAIFAESIELLQSVITEKLNKNTLSESLKFQSLVIDMPDESSYFIYKSKDELAETNNNYNAAAVLFSYDTDFAHVSGNFINYKAPAKKNSITEYFSIELSKDLIIAPQTVKNHITKARDIITQDVDNNLYLISSNGKILWKKQLYGKILGNVEQIDTYRNGRLQLVFATENRVYVIDRNGKDVGKFPLKFNDVITQPLSVFDYDNNKNYRLLITQDKSLLMYDAKGDRVKGFEFDPAKNSISSQPKHFRTARKDYIVFSQGNILEIINRKGKTRVPVSAKIRFSGNDIFLYQNKFTTTNTLGELIQVDTKGKLSRKQLQLSNDHHIVTTSKTLASLSDNRLSIRSQGLDLEFGDYTPPKIFYINDKIYVSTTDQQAKKVYLFDSQAKPITNFPIFGTSSADLQKLDNDSGLELITQSDSKTITVYKLN